MVEKTGGSSMKVTRNTRTVKASDIKIGDTFRYTDVDGTRGDFLRMKKNSCFRILFSCGTKRADSFSDILIYNISAMCFGTLDVGADVTPTNSELIING
jgi:hypothetical protein